MNLFTASLILIASAATLTTVTYGAGNEDAPVRWRSHDGIQEIMRSSMKPIKFVIGDIPIGEPRKFMCKSTAGCVVIVSASLEQLGAIGASPFTCIFVDGVAAAPGCGSNFFQVREQMKVSTGEHTITTTVHSYNKGGKITGWETDYTIYERKAD